MTFLQGNILTENRAVSRHFVVTPAHTRAIEDHHGTRGWRRCFFLAAALSVDQQEMKTLLDQHEAEASNMIEVHQRQLNAEKAFLNWILRMYLNQKERVERLLPVWQLQEKCILEDKHQFEQRRLQERIKNLESLI